MVMQSLARMKRAIVEDVTAFLASPRPPAGPPAGLLTYAFEPPGGKIRIHLRTQPDGTGLLFRDVTDVLHLSPTAAEMAWLALDGVSEAAATARLARRWDAPRAQLAADFRQLARVVHTLSQSSASCPTCTLDLPRTPLFSVRAQAPHKVDLALTYACNNACPHCYNDPSRFDLGSMTTAEWQRVIDLLADVGVPHLILTGGEATLHPGLEAIIAHANARGQIVGLNSNGRRLGRGDFMRRLAGAGLDHVQITLESHVAAVHDAMVGARAFEQTVAGVHAALESGVHVITNSTITRLNAEHIEDTVAFLHGLGLRTFAMNGMIYSGGGDANPDALRQDELPPILVKVRDTAAELGMRFLWYTVTEYCEMSPLELEIGAKRCNAGEYSMCVEPDGSVLPCQSFYVSAGNILRDPWERIWRGELFRSFREREDDPAWAGLPEKCHDCLDLPVCGGGCRIEREAREGKAPAGCPSCQSGGVRAGTPFPRRELRSSGTSATSRCTCKAPAQGPLVTLRVPTRDSAGGASCSSA